MKYSLINIKNSEYKKWDKLVDNSNEGTIFHKGSFLNAMNIAHPYEEVSYQIYVLENQHQLVGSGIVGELKKAIKIETFLK